MTAKQYLKQLKELDTKADSYRRHYERCLREIALLKSPRYDSDKVQSSVSGAGFTGQIERLIDAQANANRMIDKFIDQREKIIGEINGLQYPYSTVLFKKYVEYKDLLVVATEMNYSYDWIVELHGRALQAFASSYNLLPQ